ncbi:MAG TPA: hypothetical protein VMY42_10775 [Thermoguttaceae bacterium]|nr:hypothetical protein [Thermoguttaceae bacterium]
MWRAIVGSTLRWSGAYCLFVLLLGVFLFVAWPHLLLRRLAPKDDGFGS